MSSSNNSSPCKYDKTMHRDIKKDETVYKDVFWHRFEMRCKLCGKLFGVYNQKTMVKEYFDMIYAPNIDPEQNNILKTDPRMAFARVKREVDEANKEHEH